MAVHTSEKSVETEVLEAAVVFPTHFQLLLLAVQVLAERAITAD